MSDTEFLETAHEIQVLTRPDLIMGIPLPFFVMSVSVAFGVGFSLSLILGASLGIIFIGALHELHKTDPQAAEIWIDRVKSRMQQWMPGRKQQLHIVFI